MKRLFIIILIIALALVAFLSLIKRGSPKLDSSAQPYLTINNIKVNLRIAQTPAEITKGLGGTTHLDEYEGMLFIFPQDNIKPSFWMKDMIIDLDMIWIDDNKVVDIHKNVPADDQQKLYIPKQPVDYILEVNAGFADKNNIQIGDSVDLSNIRNN